MAISVNSGGVSSGVIDAQASLTFSHTIAAGTDRVLFVGLSWWAGGSAITLSGVTFGGVAMTLVATATNATENDYCSIYRLINPAVSTANIVASFSGNTDIVGGGITLNGVHQTTPVRNSNTATGNNNTASVGVTSAVNDLVLAAFHHHYPEAVPHGYGASQTGRWDANSNGGNDTNGALSTKAGASGTVTQTQDITNTRNWAAVAVSIQEAVTGTTYNDSVAETATASDSDSAVQVRTAAVTEAGSATESESALHTRIAAVTESASATDVTNAAGSVYNRAVTEAATATETENGLAVRVAAITEAASATESQSALQVRAAAIVEAASAGDSTDALKILVAAIVESVTASDSTNTAGNIFTAALTEAASATESESALKVLVAAIVESATATDSTASLGGIFTADVTETATASDSSDGSVSSGLSSVTESASAADVVSALRITYAAIIEAGNAAEIVTASTGVVVVDGIVHVSSVFTTASIQTEFSVPESTVEVEAAAVSITFDS